MIGDRRLVVFLPDRLLARLHKRAQRDRRTVRATVELALEEFMAGPPPCVVCGEPGCPGDCTGELARSVGGDES